MARTSASKKFCSSASGQPFVTGLSAAEYGVLGLCAVLVALGGLLTIGTGLHQRFEQFGDSLLLTQNPSDDRDQAAVTPVKIKGPSPIAGMGKTLKISLKSGAVVSVPDYPVPMMKAVVTAGANGTTTHLASTLQRFADTLLASGEITQKQYNGLVELANQGHHLAHLEGLVEEATQNTNSGLEFQAKVVRDEGKTYRVADLVSQYGRRSQFTQNGELESSEDYAETAKFIELRDKALSSLAPVLSPAAKTIVNSLAEDIINLSRASSNAGYWGQGNGTSVATYDAYLFSISYEYSASAATHQHSQTLCHMGGRQDIGIQCQ